MQLRIYEMRPDGSVTLIFKESLPKVATPNKGFSVKSKDFINLNYIPSSNLLFCGYEVIMMKLIV